MKKLFILIPAVILLAALVSIFSNSIYSNPEKELIKRVLEIAVVSGEIPDFNLMENTNKIVISSANITQEYIPDLSGIELIVMSPSEIKEKANKEGDFLYLEFGEIQINKISASISINNKWAVSDNTKGMYLSGGGMKIKFHKGFRGWIEEKEREIWIS